MPNDSRVVIGSILGAHGVKGEIKLRPLTDYPDRFYDMPQITLYRGGAEVGTYHVLNVRDQLARGFFLVSLHGVDDMDSAEALRGCTVEITSDERVPLPKGEFWISDLIGLDAFDDEGVRLGSVKDITNSGHAQLIVVEGDDGREHLVPAAPEFLLNADLAAKRITLHLVEGLWEL